MNNKELAKALMSRVPLDSNNHDDIREAAARLCKLDIIVAAQKAKGAASKREREETRDKSSSASRTDRDLLVMDDEKRISDAVIQSLRDKKLEMAGEIAAKEAEVSALRALVGEMADALDTTIHYRDFICDCGEPSLHNCSVRSRVCFAKNRLLVMKARNAVKAEGGER